MKKTVFFYLLVIILAFSINGCRNKTTPCAHPSWGAWIYSANICTTSGTRTRTCSNCPEIQIEYISALGHDHSIFISTTATCTVSGNTTYQCSRCDHINIKPEAAFGHDHFESLICKRDNCTHQYSLGDTGPGGGRIFYVADGVGGRYPFTLFMHATDTLGITAHYLEVAPAHFPPTFAWASGTGWNTLIPNLSQNSTDETDWAIGRGKKNTAIIIAHGSNSNPAYSTPAATACVEYAVSGFETFKGDWFLPSRNELHQLFINRVAVGGTFQVYLSSSQSSANHAWRQNLNSGAQVFDSKNVSAFARAIRAF